MLMHVGIFMADLAHVYTNCVNTDLVTKFYFPHISRSSVISQIN